MATPALDPRAAEVLDFWFGSEPDDAAVAARQAGLWWRHDPAADAEVEGRFGRLTATAATGDLDPWQATPRGNLALILLLDQLPRMIHRGTPAAFATDPAARVACRAGLVRDDQRVLRPIEQLFLLLPLEHSENLADQEECVARLEQLAATVPDAWRATFDGFVDFAVRHRDIIARFGRFPHRNQILGRTSSADEQAFLTQPGSSF